jgi:transcriptional regulator with XRE-family HTH domain
MDRVAMFRRLRKSAGMTLPEMAVLLRVPERSLTKKDAAARDRTAKKLLMPHPARSQGPAKRRQQT